MMWSNWAKRRRNESFRLKESVKPDFEQKTWDKLQAAIFEICDGIDISDEFEDLHRNAYKMVLHGYGDKLYAGVEATLTARVKEMSKSIEAAQGGSFLEELSRKWTLYDEALHIIQDMLMHMDKTNVSSNRKTPVYKLGLNLWRHNVYHSCNIQTRLLNALLDLILKERTGDVIKRGLMRNVIKMLMDLGAAVYEEDFEKPFLEMSANFYRVESQQFIECCDCGEYLKKAERRLNEEIERVSHYLDLRSEAKITNVVEKEMIANHMHPLVHMENSGLVNMLLNDIYDDLGRMYNLFRWVEKGLSTIEDVMASHIRETWRELVNNSALVNHPVKFVQRLLDEIDKHDKIISHSFDNDKTFQNAVNLLIGNLVSLNHGLHGFIYLFVDDDKYEELRRMYNLFSRVENGLSTFRDVMSSLISKTSEQLVTDPERVKDPVEVVQRLLDEKDKYDKIISLSFYNSKTFQNALNSSFEFFINLNPRLPEFISLFLDDKLCKGFKGVSEEDVDVVLDKLMTLFCYLQEKDVFEEYYRRHLAKRLLSGKTVSDDAERSLLDRVKIECGYQFTSKLEDMFLDMRASQDTMQVFYSSLGAELTDEPTLAVEVLKRAWPPRPNVPRNLQAELFALWEKFPTFGTRIGTSSWDPRMGHAGFWVTVTFRKGQDLKLNVSIYQLCVLMVFDNADKLSYKEIEQASQIPAVELKRCLQSLACVEGKNVLRKEPMSEDIAEDDSFLFNDKFTSKVYRVQITTDVAQEELKPEKQEKRQSVKGERMANIDSAIVRLMRNRRVLGYNQIIAEAPKLLPSRFIPRPLEIKKRIESLIARQYLERDGTNRKLYHYLN